MAATEGREKGAGRGPLARRGRASPRLLATASSFPLSTVLSSSSTGVEELRRRGGAAGCGLCCSHSLRTALGRGGGSALPSSSSLFSSSHRRLSPVPLLPPSRKAPDLLRAWARGRFPPRRGTLPWLPLAGPGRLPQGRRHPPARFPPHPGAAEPFTEAGRGATASPKRGGGGAVAAPGSARPALPSPESPHRPCLGGPGGCLASPSPQE